MQLDIVGASPGFTYRITVQDINPLTGQVHRAKEAVFVMGNGNQSSTELKLKLSIFDAEQGELGNRVLPRICRGFGKGDKQIWTSKMLVCLMPTALCSIRERDGSVCVACISNDDWRSCKLLTSV